MATYPPSYSYSCVTEKVPYTTSVPYETYYVTYADAVTTPPPSYSTSTYTSCPYSYSCYTSYYSTPVPAYPSTYRVYSTYTTSTYTPSVTYSYSTSCPCPYPTSYSYSNSYSTVCPTYSPKYPPPAYTTYRSKRSISDDQASVAPVVVGVARVLGIVALLGLLIYYFVFKRASRRLSLGESDRKDNSSDPYGSTEAGSVRQYVQDEPIVSAGRPTPSIHRAGVASRV